MFFFSFVEAIVTCYLDRVPIALDPNMPDCIISEPQTRFLPGPGSFLILSHLLSTPPTLIVLFIFIFILTTTAFQ